MTLFAEVFVDDLYFSAQITVFGECRLVPCDGEYRPADGVDRVLICFDGGGCFELRVDRHAVRAPDAAG